MKNEHLHSNMVRFIILEEREKYANRSDLHSNMVRFIITINRANNELIKKFTFQYGQIYYRT